MARERIVSGEAESPEEERYNIALRPQRLAECIGQKELIEKLIISITAAKQRGEPLEHVLLHGPPGLGKTTIAHVIANEMGTNIRVTSGPALIRPGDLMGILTNMEPRDVLFIDEIHRLPPVVEEFIYPAMEDFKVDFTVDQGIHARTINLPLAPFTLIGATTRAGMIQAPLRNRFGHFYHLDFWNEADLVEMLGRSAGLLKLTIAPEALTMLARRARGTPRIANRLLRRARDYAQVKADGKLTVEVVDTALRMEGIDRIGLDDLDRKLLATVIDFYAGGPVGIEAIAATLNEETDTLVDMVEPYLLKIGFLARTRKGRMVLDDAYAHLGRKPAATTGKPKPAEADEPEDKSLFD
jgi:Holliday junction DNA helicase RuvB